MISWDVFVVRKTKQYVKTKCIDTVFFNRNCDAQYVHSSLVEHDGYPSDIIVRNNELHSRLHSGENIEDYAWAEQEDEETLVSMYCWPKENEL